MNILIAIDPVDTSSKALQQALSLLNHQNMTFLLLSVEEPVTMPNASPVPGVMRMGEESVLEWQQEAELARAEEQQMQSALSCAEESCRQAGVQFISRTELGQPKHAICEVAQQENCQLIVVGSHSYGWFEKMLAGSVSEYVMHHTHCHVLIVRE